jgi:predicted amidohydrolase YtcJ
VHGEQADLLFCNGTVFDGYRFLPPGTAVRVRGSRIIALERAPAGQDRSPCGGTTVVDLHGGTLLPGFIDAHVHPVFGGQRMSRCDLVDGRSLPEYVDIIAAYLREHPGDGWITGGGWSMEAFPGGVPTAAELDRLAPDRPVFLPNRDGHGAWVNSRAMQLAGIDAATPDPADGRIERDEHGAAVGMLQEGAAGLVSRLIPAPTEADWDAALLAGQTYLLELGITGWQDAIVGRDHGGDDTLPVYLRAAADGRLRSRVVGALWWERGRGIEQLPELIERRRLASEVLGATENGTGDGRFRAVSVKMMLDGVAENHTAAMLEPYLDGHGCATDETGLDFIDPGELPRYVSELDRAGFQVHFHALGDRAVRHALDAVEAARRSNGDSGQRHHLAHLQVVHPDDVPRFAQLRATANIQPLWATHEPQMDELTIPFLGERRAGWQYPFASLHAAGAELCAGSDWPVSSPNPLWGAHVAVNRAAPDEIGPDGTVPAGPGPAGPGPAGPGPAGTGSAHSDPFLPAQRLALTTILAAYTSGSARINGLESVTGAVRPGLDADFAVVDADLSHIASHEIGSAAVVATWIRGALAYQQGQPA